MNIIQIHDTLHKYRNVEVRLVDIWDDELLTEVPTYVCRLGQSTSLSEVHALIDQRFRDAINDVF